MNGAFDPAEWRDFFVAVATGAATLTGLVFIAMSLHLKVILSRPVLRHRAAGVLATLMAVFVQCALALMGGQDQRAVGTELFVVSALLSFALARNYRDVIRSVEKLPFASLARFVASGLLQFVVMGGAAMLYTGQIRGLYLVGISMMTSFYFTVSGAWLLLIGATHEERAGR